MAAASYDVQSDDGQFRAHHRNSASNPLEAVVCLLDGGEFSVTCPEGRYTTAESLLGLAADHLRLNPDSLRFFAIWVISGSLHLQMKPDHLPFRVMKKWPELLETYSNSDPHGEIPAVYIRRSAHVTPMMEKRIKDPVAVKLLFGEMTFNIIYSLYPCTLEDAVYLAAIHLQLEKGRKANKKDVLKIEGCCVPPHLEPIREKTWIKHVLDARAKLPIEQDEERLLHHLYLERGWEWSVYSSTFFFGEIEADDSGTILQERPDLVVRVGVNLDGIHVIEDKKNTIKLSLPYHELRYNSFEDPESGEASFVIEYEEEDEEQNTVSAKMVIWTAQAAMIDNLVTQFVEEESALAENQAQRRHQRGLSVRPPRQAKGRTAASGVSRAKNFSISRFAKSMKKGGKAAPRERQYDTPPDIQEHPM
eukprot:m.30541 g.30541  ORF g.30541 m.30541 type:complete len:419 (-) comp9476_c0_seq1:87-1343(-)